MTTTYRVDVTHHDDGEVDVQVHDVGDSEQDRAAVAYALRQAADMVERGQPVRKENFN